MPPLPALSGREVVQVFVALGWEVARQRGSHIVLVKDGHMATLSVPDHRHCGQRHSAVADPCRQRDRRGIPGSSLDRQSRPSVNSDVRRERRAEPKAYTPSAYFTVNVSHLVVAAVCSAVFVIAARMR